VPDFKSVDWNTTMLKQIMKTAWNIFRANRDHLTFAEALKMAWLTVQKDAEYIVTVSTDGGHKMYACMSSEGAHRVRKEITLFWKERGLRVFGADITRVAHHLAAVEVSTAAETKRVPARAVRDVQPHGLTA
jgi:hypothetical protein